MINQIDMSNQTFSEEEIARIIKKAAQLESQQQNSDDSKPGLTLEELATAASDAGLDPENIRIAAKQIRQDSTQNKITRTTDTSGQVFAERWVNGKLSEELTDSVIADLKHRYDASEAERNWFKEWHDESWEENYGKSSVQKTGRSVEWKHIDKSGSLETRVLIQPRGKQIRVRVSKRNIWDEKGGPGGEVYEYIAGIPFVAGIVLLFTLPFEFLVNAMIGMITFIGLQIVISPFVKKLRDKWGDRLFHRKRNRIEDNRASYKNEVEKVSGDLADILKTELDESMINDPKKIEIEHLENNLRNADEENRPQKSGKKNRTS